MNKMRYNKDMAENTPSRDRNDSEKISQKIILTLLMPPNIRELHQEVR